MKTHDRSKNSCTAAEEGFTLIELLVVIAILSILCYLGVTSFYVYKSDVAYHVAEQTLRDARTALEAGLSDLDRPPDPVPLTAQTESGSIRDAAANTLLRAMQLPKDVKFQVAHDPDCVTSACEAEFLQVDHCKSKEYIRWIRFGDGVDITLMRVEGADCT